MNEYVTWFITLLTHAEWSALLWLVVATMAATHTIKVLWRLSPIPGTGTGFHFVPISAGLALMFAGVLWPEASNAPWFVGGIIAGPASNVIFTAVMAALDKFAPDFANKVNARDL